MRRFASYTYPCTSHGAIGVTACLPSWKRCESPESFHDWFSSPRGVRRSYSTNPSPSRSPYSSIHRNAASAGSLQLERERAVVRPAPGLREQDQEQRRRVGACRSSGRTSGPRTCRAAPRARSSPARRRATGSSSVAWSAASSRSAPRASSGPNSRVCRHVISVSRPKIVMNHGMPAAGSRPCPASPARMRSAARSLTDRENVWRRSSQSARICGTLQLPGRERLAEHARAPRRSAARRRAGAASAAPSGVGTTSIRSFHVSRGASATSNAIADPFDVALAPRRGSACCRSPPGRRARTGSASARRTRHDRVGQRLRAARVAEREVPLLDGDDVCEVGAELDPDADVELLRRHVRERDVILHPVADEALALDRHRVEREIRRSADCAGRTRRRSTRRRPTRAAAAACRRASAPAARGSACRRRRARASSHRRRRARRRCRTSSLRGSSAAPLA